jgi:uncharacterized cupin superfamily protein
VAEREPVFEATLVETDGGLEPDGDGWFVVNVADACWWSHEAFGTATAFEGDGQRFRQVGINIQVLEPGEPNCLYHRESSQEGFLVLHGECVLLVEEQERRLHAWDFVHCPADTEHVFVGAGDGPCAILMIGARPARDEDEELLYPVSELAQRHGAGVAEETPDPRVAYAPYQRSVRARPVPRGLPWEQA